MNFSSVNSTKSQASISPHHRRLSSLSVFALSATFGSSDCSFRSVHIATGHLALTRPPPKSGLAVAGCYVHTSSFIVAESNKSEENGRQERWRFDAFLHTLNSLIALCTTEIEVECSGEFKNISIEEIGLVHEELPDLLELRAGSAARSCEVLACT